LISSLGYQKFSLRAMPRARIEFVLDVAPAARKPSLVTARAQKRGAIDHDEVSVVPRQPDPVAFHEALRSSGPVMRMRDLVRSELEHNVPRREVLGQLESLRIELRGSGRGDEEDVVLDVMDFAGGWSSPHMQL
jgi:hypothetical protein